MSIATHWGKGMVCKLREKESKVFVKAKKRAYGLLMADRKPVG